MNYRWFVQSWKIALFDTAIIDTVAAVWRSLLHKILSSACACLSKFVELTAACHDHAVTQSKAAFLNLNASMKRRRLKVYCAHVSFPDIVTFSALKDGTVQVLKGIALLCANMCLAIVQHQLLMNRSYAFLSNLHPTWDQLERVPAMLTIAILTLVAQ